MKAALQNAIAGAFPGAVAHCLEDTPALLQRDVVSNAPTLLVAVLTDVAPEAEDLFVFARSAERSLTLHEKRAVAVPIFVSRAASTAALSSALSDQRSLKSRFGSERIFAVKGTILSLLLAPNAQLSDLDWAAFCDEMNLYGFSVERVPAVLRMPGEQPFSPYSLPDFGCFVALAMEPHEPAVAIDLSQLPAVYNGTTEYALNVSRALVRQRLGGRSWTVIATSAVRTAFGLDDWGAEIVAPRDIRRLYDFVFVPHQIFSLAQLQSVTSISLRYAICMLDAIALRCDYLREQVPSRRPASEVAVKYANAVLSLSVAGADDLRSYYESEGMEVRVAPVLITKDVPPGRIESSPPYVLVVGNRYHHKAIFLFLERFLANPARLPLTVVADEETQARFGADRNLNVLVSGNIPEERMASLYENAAAVVFPSLYEGFGLPVLGGILRGKPVLAIDNQANRELKEAFDTHEYLTLLPTHSAIVDRLRTAAFESPVAPRQPSPPAAIRTWDDVARDTLAVLEKAYAEPVVWPRLFSRMREVSNLVDAASARPASLKDASLRRLRSLVPSRIAAFLSRAARSRRRRGAT